MRNGSLLTQLTQVTRVVIVASLLYVGSIPQSASSEDLKNLLESRAMREFDGNINGTARAMGIKGNEWTRGMDPNANFTSIWEYHDSGRVLLNWLGTRLSYYHSKRARSGRQNDHVWASAELVNNKKVEVVITILVPHPSVRPLVETHVFNLFRKYRPPDLEVISEKNYDLKGAKGTLYEGKSGRCSMVVDTAEFSIVNIETDECKDAAILVDVAQSLDFERLNKKLSS